MEPEQPTGGATRYIVGLIIIALIIIGISFAGGKRNAPTESDVTEQETAAVSTSTEKETMENTPAAEAMKGGATEVVYTTSDGFTPDNLSVKVGDTVKFVKKSTEGMWVASATHPTHTVYGGTTLKEHCPDTSGTAFDQCESGNEYSFTFAKAGTWAYHNHLRVGMYGKVIVK